MFDSCQCDSGGGTEWFEPTSELLDFIGSFTPDTVEQVQKLEKKLETTKSRIFADIAEKVFGKTPSGRSVGKKGAEHKAKESSGKTGKLAHGWLVTDTAGINSRYGILTSSSTYG